VMFNFKKQLPLGTLSTNLGAVAKWTIRICNQIWIGGVWQKLHSHALCGSPRGSTCALTETICLPSWLSQKTPSRRHPGPTHSLTHSHVQRSVHLSALLITWFTWGDGLQRRYASDVAFCIVRFPLTIDNSDMN
jgi:hypothetical protein